MLYEKYKNEAEFRNSFVRPLLTKLGFLSIAELDGSQEFGKDFVFSEITPFGFMRHYGIVVKHEKKLNQPGKLCETVLSQIKQAFSVSFSLPESAKESHVSSVLVMNSGSISPNAEHWMRSELFRERYGENVHIFSGERLLQLDNTVAFNQQQMLIPRLLGLENSIKLNVIVWNSIEESLPDFSESRGSFTRALEDFVTLPFLTEHINLNEVVLLLQECRIIDSINNRGLMGIYGSNNELKTRDVDSMKGILKKARIRAITLMDSVEFCISCFKPIV